MQAEVFITENRIAKLNAFFDAQIAACAQSHRELLADGRGDEAVFEKVKSNIYDIFRTVLSVGTKTCANDPDALKSFFFLRLERIPADWVAAHEKAAAHGDTQKMHLEQLKLDTVAQIKEKFLEIWEGKQ